MGQLTPDEEREWERLKKRREAPDPQPVSRSVAFSVDLGKKDQVELARKLRLIDDDDDDGGGGSTNKGETGDGEAGGERGAGGRKPDTAPKRSAYFGNKGR